MVKAPYMNDAALLESVTVTFASAIGKSESPAVEMTYEMRQPTDSDVCALCSQRIPPARKEQQT